MEKFTKAEQLILGRHQQFCLIKKFLGEKVTDEETELAHKKDSYEYDVIFNELETIKSFINSNGGIKDAEVAKKVREDIQALIQKGYKSCVLQNNPDLQSACFEVFDEYYKYTLEVARHQNRENEISENMKKKMGLLDVQRLLSYYTLGYIDTDPNKQFLDTALYQHAWYILEALHPVNKNEWSLITAQIAHFCIAEKCAYENLPEKVRSIHNSVLSLADSSVKEGKITPDQFKVIEEQITLGKNYCKGQIK